MTAGTLRLAADRYARLGLAVMPCKPRGKAPMTRHGVKDATCDRELIDEWWRRWPDANIGLATTNIFVVDLDGPEGLTGWQELTATWATVDTVIVETGRGKHLWFRAPKTIGLKNTVKNLAPGVDTRGIGGHVLAPPSVHATGAIYTFASSSSRIADCPGWLIELLQVRPVPSRPIGQTIMITPTYAGAALQREILSVARAVEGTRNHTLNRASFCLGQLVATGALGQRDVVDALLRAAALCGLPALEAERTIVSGMTSGQQRPRSAP